MNDSDYQIVIEDCGDDILENESSDKSEMNNKDDDNVNTQVTTEVTDTEIPEDDLDDLDIPDFSYNRKKVKVEEEAKNSSVSDISTGKYNKSCSAFLSLFFYIKKCPYYFDILSYLILLQDKTQQR